MDYTIARQSLLRAQGIEAQARVQGHREVDREAVKARVNVLYF